MLIVFTAAQKGSIPPTPSIHRLPRGLPGYLILFAPHAFEPQRQLPSDAASVWMSEMELVELFNVIVPTLRATVRSVYKSGVLKSCEVETRIRLPNGYYAEAYALPMVVALAFHINTPNAARVRNALLERMCLRKDRQMLWLSLSDRQPCKC